MLLTLQIVSAEAKRARTGDVGEAAAVGAESVATSAIASVEAAETAAVDEVYAPVIKTIDDVLAREKILRTRTSILLAPDKKVRVDVIA